MKAYREAEGWKFYYSPEGYPYYFNDVTGVSEWATQDTYYSSLEDEHTAQQHGYYGEAESTGNSSSPTKAKAGAKSRAYERTADDDEEVGSRNEDDDEDEDDEEDGEEEEDEESGSSSLDEGLEKRFRQYLRTPEGIAAVLEEQERIIKYMEQTEKKKQRKQETQYLKSLFLNKKYDGEAKPAPKKKTGEAAASVLSTTVAAAWSWITEKPPAEESKETKESKRGSGAKSGSTGGSGKGTATQRVKSSGQDTGGDSTEKDVEQPADEDGGSDGGDSDDDGNDDDEDASSLSSEDSDVEVIKAPLFSELPAWMSWKTVEERVLQPSSEFLSRTVASIATTTSTNGDGSTTSGSATNGTDGLWQNVSHQAWQISVTAATFTGTLTYLVITRTYAVMEPYLITFMEQIIDIDQNNTQSQNNPLAQAHQRRIEDLSPRPRPSYPPPPSSSAAHAAATMASPRFPIAPPSTPRPEMVTPRGSGGMDQLPAVPPRSAPLPRAVVPPPAPQELAIPAEIAAAAADDCVTPPALDVLEQSIGHETPNASGWKEIASDEDLTPVTTTTTTTTSSTAVAAVSDSPVPMEAAAVTEAPSEVVPSSEITEIPIEETTRVIV